MQKLTKLSTFLWVLFAMLGVNSALANGKSPAKAALPLQCEKAFAETNKILAEAERQPGTHTQLKKMKSKLASTKEQIQKMDSQTQQKSCDKVLLSLNQLKQKN